MWLASGGQQDSASLATREHATEQQSAKEGASTDVRVWRERQRKLSERLARVRPTALDALVQISSCKGGRHRRRMSVRRRSRSQLRSRGDHRGTRA